MNMHFLAESGEKLGILLEKQILLAVAFLLNPREH